MIIRRIIENVNVVRGGANPARITVRRNSAVVAQRFGTVNITRVIQSDAVELHGEAGEGILAGQPARTGSDGRFYLASANDGDFAGIFKSATASGATAVVISEGKLTLSDWSAALGSVSLTPRQLYFLSTTGTISTAHSIAGYAVKIGRGFSSQTMLVQKSVSIKL